MSEATEATKYIWEKEQANEVEGEKRHAKRLKKGASACKMWEAVSQDIYEAIIS